MTWSARRAAEQPGLTVLVAIFEVMLTLGVYLYYGTSWALLTFGVITLALIPFYASYKYVLRRDGLEVHGPLYYTPYQWDQFDGWRLNENELRLIFKKGRSSVLVLFAPHNMQNVVTFVQGSLPRLYDEEDRRLQMGDDRRAREREVLEKFAREIARRRMCAPAIFLFESIRPLAFVAGQALAFIEPLLKVLFDAPDYKVFREAIEDRENVEWLVCRLEELEGTAAEGE